MASPDKKPRPLFNTKFTSKVRIGSRPPSVSSRGSLFPAHQPPPLDKDSELSPIRPHPSPPPPLSSVSDELLNHSVFDVPPQTSAPTNNTKLSSIQALLSPDIVISPLNTDSSEDLVPPTRPLLATTSSPHTPQRITTPPPSNPVLPTFSSSPLFSSPQRPTPPRPLPQQLTPVLSIPPASQQSTSPSQLPHASPQNLPSSSPNNVSPQHLSPNHSISLPFRHSSPNLLQSHSTPLLFQPSSPLLASPSRPPHPPRNPPFQHSPHHHQLSHVTFAPTTTHQIASPIPHHKTTPQPTSHVPSSNPPHRLQSQQSESLSSPPFPVLSSHTSRASPLVPLASAELSEEVSVQHTTYAAPSDLSAKVTAFQVVHTYNLTGVTFQLLACHSDNNEVFHTLVKGGLASVPFYFIPVRGVCYSTDPPLVYLARKPFGTTPDIPPPPGSSELAARDRERVVDFVATHLRDVIKSK